MGTFQFLLGSFLSARVNAMSAVGLGHWVLRPCRIRTHHADRLVQARAASKEQGLFLTPACERLLNQGWTVDDSFAPQLVSSLREEFMSRFENPLEVSADRFIWDYWLVPHQYALMRTTAEAFFAPATYQLLEERVLEWAATLGCRSCSPMWLSYYVDGHAQELHTDAPHGPFAFVLSLTDFEHRRFTGGETQLLKQETVLRSFWEDAGTAKEVNQLFDFIEPRLGRLTVFDGRIPHGVRQVRGVQDPREGRIVVHGWFTVRKVQAAGTPSELSPPLTFSLLVRFRSRLRTLMGALMRILRQGS